MQQLPPVLYRGSVKNVRGEVSAPFLLFEFSDRYSVFDWGEMPDQLSEKGKCLALMGKSFFTLLEKKDNWISLATSDYLYRTFDSDFLESLFASDLYKEYCLHGINHHAVLSDLDLTTPTLKVKNVKVLRPAFNGKKYNYTLYKERPVNALVPLEIIFRLGLPKGNSLSKRMGTDQAKWAKCGFSSIPAENELLKKPVIDFSTKLERGDRYLELDEAKSIASLNEVEWKELNQMALLIGLHLAHFHHQLGLELWDGKIEVAFNEDINGKRNFMLVDSIGIDELRLLYKNKSFSKEFLREVYKESIWYKNLETSKKLSKITGEDFKKICLDKFSSTPDPLRSEIKERAESVYKSYANAVTAKIMNKEFFSEKYRLHAYAERYL